MQDFESHIFHTLFYTFVPKFWIKTLKHIKFDLYCYFYNDILKNSQGAIYGKYKGFFVGLGAGVIILTQG